MKSKVLIAALVVVGIVVILVLVRPGSKPVTTTPGAAPAVTAPGPGAPTEEGAASSATGEAATPAVTPGGIEATSAPAQPQVHVFPPPPVEAVEPEDATNLNLSVNEVLATVNGEQVTLGHLVPIRKGQGLQRMNRDDYERRLNQAIDQKLVEQQAKAQNVTLTPDQQANADSIRARKKADIEYNRSQGQIWTSVTDEQIEFEVHHVEDLILLQNLLKEICPPLQPAEADIQKYYDENKAKYGNLPEDPSQREILWQQISADATSVLMPVFQDAYLKCQESYLAGQKAKSNVIVVKPAH